MTEDDLAERVRQLEQQNKALKAKLSAYEKKFDRLLTLCIGQDREFAEFDTQMDMPLYDRTERLDDRLAEVEKDATSALAVTKTRADGGDRSKVDVAAELTRDELVRKAVKGHDRSESDGEGLLVSDVQRMARPQTDLAYQTVKDAWGNLETNWGAILVGNGEDGNRRAKIKTEAIGRPLLAAVEESLGRDDLTKELISRKESAEGGN